MYSVPLNRLLLTAKPLAFEPSYIEAVTQAFGRYLVASGMSQATAKLYSERVEAALAEFLLHGENGLVNPISVTQYRDSVGASTRQALIKAWAQFRVFLGTELPLAQVPKMPNESVAWVLPEPVVSTARRLLTETTLSPRSLSGARWSHIRVADGRLYLPHPFHAADVSDITEYEADLRALFVWTFRVVPESMAAVLPSGDGFPLIPMGPRSRIPATGKLLLTLAGVPGRRGSGRKAAPDPRPVPPAPVAPMPVAPMPVAPMPVPEPPPPKPKQPKPPRPKVKAPDAGDLPPGWGPSAPPLAPQYDPNEPSPEELAWDPSVDPQGFRPMTRSRVEGNQRIITRYGVNGEILGITREPK